MILRLDINMCDHYKQWIKAGKVIVIQSYLPSTHEAATPITLRYTNSDRTTLKRDTGITAPVVFGSPNRPQLCRGKNLLWI